MKLIEDFGIIYKWNYLESYMEIINKLSDADAIENLKMYKEGSKWIISYSFASPHKQINNRKNKEQRFELISFLMGLVNHNVKNITIKYDYNDSCYNYSINATF